jgi:hypothetical protein
MVGEGVSEGNGNAERPRHEDELASGSVNDTEIKRDITQQGLRSGRLFF